MISEQARNQYVEQLISSILTHYWSDCKILFVKSKGKSDQTLKQTAWQGLVKKIRATLAITEPYAPNEIMINKNFLLYRRQYFLFVSELI